MRQLSFFVSKTVSRAGAFGDRNGDKCQKSPKVYLGRVLLETEMEKNAKSLPKCIPEG